MERSNEWARTAGRSSRLGTLMAEARKSRRARRRGRAAEAHSSDAALRRRRAEGLVERLLSGPLPELVDCSRYLNRLATQRQVASHVIDVVMTSVQGVVLNAVPARALAVAIAEMLHFFEGSVSDGQIRVYLAVALDDGQLVAGLGVEGDVACVASREAHRSLLRARSITKALGGDFQRGVDGPRMVFGLTFPNTIAECPQ